MRLQRDMPPCTIAFPVTNEQKGEDTQLQRGGTPRLPAIPKQSRKTAAESKAIVDPLVTSEHTVPGTRRGVEPKEDKPPFVFPCRTTCLIERGGTPHDTRGGTPCQPNGRRIRR